MEETYRSDVNYDVTTRDFKYYIFDWDDNILHMPTRIYLEKMCEDGVWRPVAVSTSTYALVRTDESRYRMPLKGGRAAAFRDFYRKQKQLCGFRIDLHRLPFGMIEFPYVAALDGFAQHPLIVAH